MRDLAFTKIAANGLLTNEIQLTKLSVTGREKLAQEVARALLNTPGTSSFNSEYGGGFSKLSSYTFENDEDAKAVVISIVKDAERSILKSQSGRTLPDDETLRSIEVGNVAVDNANVTVDLYVVTANNVAYNLNVVV